MKHRKFISLAIVPILVATFIATTATLSLASISINPRLSGSDRYETSTAIANQFSNQTVSNVVLASGNDFPDALSASVLAHELSAPILLVDRNTQTSKAALDYIQAHLQPQGTVYITGGTSAIGSDFDSVLSSQGYQIKRLGGSDLYDTNELIVNELNSTSDTVYIASGQNFPDALAISSFASQTNSPILLTQTNGLPKGAQEYLTNNEPKNIYIAGGTAVVSVSVENEIKSISPNSKITRFAGQTRFDTASLAYGQLATNPKTIYVASGLNYPDALSGTVLAALNGDPILLIDPSTPLVPDSIAMYLSQLYKNGATPNVTALGGSVVVPDEVINNVVNLLNGKSQSPLFNITKVDSRLNFGGLPVNLLPNKNYWFNINTYKYNYPYSSFHSSVEYNLYYYMLNLDNQVSVHNRALALHGGITTNNCVYFQAEALRRIGFNISNSMANTIQFSNLLSKLGFKKDTDIGNLKPGDIVFTKGYSHTYTFMGWVNPGNYDYAYIVDNQSRSFGGQVYHVRSTTGDPGQNTDGMAFFMYY
ncbi:cell wall-binding repeat-containing protein [Desulfosporosinus hippei]|uniref:Putative cell wall binding repeat 2 n=1 Tax=Desulfosporosinus hippei DSM 8344 TaxID=1121419 RepID=A0A1G8I602_9FIRM|nr:cell wall-binding repeat-containing protein [Desulfosporosinus hippei]SDI14264.1 Putative cell wall binding repeat 2 [Desulfosporosinus hippei DSM 8344]